MSRTRARRQRGGLVFLIGVALVAACACSSSSARPPLQSLVVTAADLSPQWHSFTQAAGQSGADSQINRCLSRTATKAGPQHDGEAFADNANHVVTSSATRSPSAASAIRLRRIEATVVYPRCLAESLRERYMTAQGVRLDTAVVPTRLVTADADALESAVRLSFNLTLSGGSIGPATLDRYVLWHGTDAINVTFYGFGTEFPPTPARPGSRTSAAPGSDRESNSPGMVRSIRQDAEMVSESAPNFEIPPRTATDAALLRASRRLAAFESSGRGADRRPAHRCGVDSRVVTGPRSALG